MTPTNTIKVPYLSPNRPTTVTYDVPAGTTWNEFLALREPGMNLSGYSLRLKMLNGDRVTAEGNALVTEVALAALAARKQEGANI
jgi:hypothetical protein